MHRKCHSISTQLHRIPRNQLPRHSPRWYLLLLANQELKVNNEEREQNDVAV